MKIIDNFLKKLNTDRNTFATYILTLISAYIAIDRIVEMLLMFFTGVSYSYWGPIQYTLAIACPVFAFAFMPSSKFAKSKTNKVMLFNAFIVTLYVIAISMFTQFINMGFWLLLLSVPNYEEIITEFSYLVTPAARAISVFLPFATAPLVFSFLYTGVDDNKDLSRSIWDYSGISLADKTIGTGPYTCEVFLCTDDESGKTITIPESSRYQSLFVCGGSGSGKTSLIYEPLIARDLERKYFYREASKEMGYTALKTRIAYLNAPYDNEYLNKNFNLNMIQPSEGKEELYKAFMKKLILSTYSNTYTYKNLGLTLMAPDKEVISHMTSVCKNLGIDYHVIDPTNSESIGLNPFVYDDSSKIAMTISAALKTMYATSNYHSSESYKEDIAMQAIENLAIILKEMYPRMNDGKLPNMEDMLKMFTNFDLIEKMCEILSHDEELREKYEVTLTYFKKNFYKNAPGKENIEKYLYSVVSQLDNLLRIPGVKSILCNRTNNIDFDKVLRDSEVLFVCTERGDLGAAGHKAFGLFFLISVQNAVLRRPGIENSRVPYFLYIDEFADFICKETEAMFTMFRKYKVGVAISTQSLQQLSTPGLPIDYKNTILSNATNKIFTGNGDASELEWWSKELGTHREWTYSNSLDTNKMQYDPKYGNIQWKFVENFKLGKLQTIAQKECAYKIRAANGKPQAGKGKLNYMDSKYKEPFKVKKYNFEKFQGNPTSSPDEETSGNKKFDFKHMDFLDSEKDEYDPVQTNTTDSNYRFDNEDAIITNIKGKRNKK